jgi:hypothetical protein
VERHRRVQVAVQHRGRERALLEAIYSGLRQRVVIDAMNPLDFSGGFPPKLSVTGEDSLGERGQRALPDAEVVKAFNTIGNLYFVDPNLVGPRVQAARRLAPARGAPASPREPWRIATGSGIL